MRSGGCGRGRYLEPSAARPARGLRGSGMEGSLVRAPVPWVPVSDPPSRTYSPRCPVPTHLPPGLASTRAVADCPAEGAGACASPRPCCRGLGGGGLVLSPRGRRGHPLVPRDRTGTAGPGPIFLTKCYVIKSIECVLRFALFFFFRPTPFSLPCPSHLGLWGLMILFSSHVPAVAFLPRIHLLGEDLLQCVFSSCS